MSNSTILLVEDNRDDIELAMYALRKNKIPNDIVVARDGVEALDFLFATGVHEGRSEERKPALILLDLNIPRLNGLEVLRRMRDAPETRRIPVVILTTSDDENDIIKGYDFGVNSYIRKPVELSEFTKIINQLGLYWLVLNQSSPR
ncbi:Response regulator Rcp1 [Azospirillaceae bacterium]